MFVSTALRKAVGHMDMEKKTDGYTVGYSPAIRWHRLNEKT
jgi:hypothetical protein